MLIVCWCKRCNVFSSSKLTLSLSLLFYFSTFLCRLQRQTLYSSLIANWKKQLDDWVRLDGNFLPPTSEMKCVPHFIWGKKMLFSLFLPFKLYIKKNINLFIIFLQKARNRAIDSKHAHKMKYPSHLVSYAKSFRKIS